jgi:YbbR domain-containing protein
MTTAASRWRAEGARYVRALKRMFTHNMGLKLIALAMAIGLFSLLRGSEDAQRSIFVDVLVLMPPPETGQMLVSDVPDRVKVTLRGSRSVLNALRDQDIPPVQIDLRKPSASYYYFETDDFELPRGAEIVQLAPASIPLAWAKRVVEDVRVQPRIDGAPAPGLVAQAVEVSPRTVRVRGPETEVDVLEHVTTEPLDVAGLAPGRHERQVPLSHPPPHTQFDHTSVRVVVEVTEQEAERSFVDVPLTAVGDPVAKLRPDTVDLTLWGSAAALEEVKRSHLVPVVDSTELDPDQGTQPLRVTVRGVPDVLQVKPVPETVLVTPHPSR